MSLFNKDARENQIGASLADIVKQIGISIDSYPVIIPEVDDTGRLRRALTDASNQLKPVILKEKTSYTISGKIDIDVSKTSLIGYNTTINFTTLTDSIGFNLFSTVSYSTNNANVKTAISGLFINGSNASTSLKSASGIYLGTSNGTEISNINIENCTIQGFTKNIEIGNNTWRVHFNNCLIKWGKLSCPSTVSNTGENMSFERCMFVDGSNLEIGRGGFNFIHCSFDNVTVRAMGDAVVISIMNSHFENPGGYTPTIRFISIEHDNAVVNLNNIDVIMDGLVGGVNYDKALFYVQDTNTMHGLHIKNIKLFQRSDYNPQLTDNIKALVAGSGRVTCSGMASWYNGYGFVIARSMNYLHNGDGELGNTNAWTSSGTGTFATDATTFKLGTQSLTVNTAASQGMTIQQDLSAKGGAWILCQLWAKINITSNGSSNFKIQFFNRLNQQIGSSIGYTNLTTTSDWTNYNINGVIPVGTEYARFVVYTSGGTGTAQIWFDDIVINVVS